MTTEYEIPLTPRPQTLSILFPNGLLYNLRLIYLFTPNDCWELDIADSLSEPLVQGIPLITGADLLSAYAYLGFGCSMYCKTDGAPDTPPAFANLGIGSHLYVSA